MNGTITLASQDLGMIITFRDISVSELRKTINFHKEELWDWILGDFFVKFEDLITGNEIDMDCLTLSQFEMVVEFCLDGAIIFNRQSVKYFSRDTMRWVSREANNLDDSGITGFSALSPYYKDDAYNINSDSGSDDYVKDWSVMAYKA